MPNKTCANCGFATLGLPECPVIHSPIDPSANYNCPYWCAELNYCVFCGNIISTHPIFTQASDGSWKAMCKNCQSLSGTCATCSKSTTCDFDTNPSPIPKAVEKRFQQGNQIMITQIKNPLRIEATCRVNCECFSEEFGCLRENNTCGKYKGVI